MSEEFIDGRCDEKTPSTWDYFEVPHEWREGKAMVKLPLTGPAGYQFLQEYIERQVAAELTANGKPGAQLISLVMSSVIRTDDHVGTAALIHYVEGKEPNYVAMLDGLGDIRDTIRGAATNAALDKLKESPEFAEIAKALSDKLQGK